MSKRVPRVGDRVRFYFGKHPIIGRVREDLGPIGIGARHLYEVVYERGEGNVYVTQFPADQMEILDPKKEPESSTSRRRLSPE